MKKIHLILLLILTIDLSAQIYPTIESNGYKSEIVDFIKSNKKIKASEFILIKSEDSYWYKTVNYRLVCFKGNNADLIVIYKKKKDNKFIIKGISTGDFAYNLATLDSLKMLGLFDLKPSDLNSDKTDKDGNVQRRVISDGVSEIFEFYSSKILWGLDIYEPREYYDFCGNKNFLIILNSIDLFNRKWENKN
jgi:hypothetical protein